MTDNWQSQDSNSGLSVFKIINLPPLQYFAAVFFCFLFFFFKSATLLIWPMLSHFRCVWLFATLWTIACPAPLFTGFSWQEYWSGSPCPLPRDLPVQGLNPCLLSLLHWQIGSSPLAPPGKLNINDEWSKLWLILFHTVFEEFILL